MVAARKGSLLIARTLLLAKAQVNSVDAAGCTALHKICAVVDVTMGVRPREVPVLGVPLSAFEGFATATGSMARLLLEFGADVNQRGPNGRTPLHFLFKTDSSWEGDRWLMMDHSGRFHPRNVAVGVLLSFGAKANARDDNGDSLIVHAYRRGDFGGVELLLASGVIVSRTDYWQMLQDLEASESLTLNAVNCFFTMPRKQPTDILNTPAFQKFVRPVWDRLLNKAARACAYKVLDALLDHGVYGLSGVDDNVLCIATMYFKPIPAAMGGTQSSLEFMTRVVARIARGPPEHKAQRHPLIDQPGEGQGQAAPLFLSISRASLDIAVVLVECGANIHLTDPGSCTPVTVVLSMAPMTPSTGLMKVAQAMIDCAAWPQDTILTKCYLISFVGNMDLDIFAERISLTAQTLKGAFVWRTWVPSFSVEKTITLALRLLDHVDINYVDPFGNAALLTLLHLVLKGAEPRQPPIRQDAYTFDAEFLSTERIEAMLALFTLLVTKGASLTIQNGESATSLDLIARVLCTCPLPAPSCDHALILAFRRYVRLAPFTSSPLERSGEARDGERGEPLIWIFNDMRFPLDLLSEEELDDPDRWVGVGRG